MKRRHYHALILSAISAALFAGCRTARNELSAPVLWHETATATVEVATAKRLLPILVEDTQQARWAASYLADVIERTCGRKPDVFVELKGQTNAWTEGLFIGGVSPNRAWVCPLAAESPEAFRVVADDSCVRFLGRADYAVFDWCERELNFRYYCSVGKCAEPRSEIVVRALDYSDRPIFEHRMIGATSAGWVRAAKAGSSHRGGVHVHAPHRWYRDEKLKAEHPEIFETGETPMLCYGNPATLKVYKERIDRHIRGLEDSGGIVNTNRKVVSVSQWDAPIGCMCSFCRDLYDESLGPSGNASPIIWGHFLKELSAWLAKEHPDYIISFLPYLNTCEVHSSLSPNTEAQLCTMPGLALLKNPEIKRKEEDLIRAWHRVTGNKVLNWHYSCWPAEQTSAPYVFGKTIQAHYTEMRDHIYGSYVCGSEDDPRLSLSSYVWMRCLWNPNVNVDAIYDEFCRRMFGVAAKPMRELIALQEQCWSRPWASHPSSLIPHPSFNNIFETCYPRMDVGRMMALLQEAHRVAAAANDEMAQKRIAWYASGFEPFLTESAELARRHERKVIELGATNEMVVARSVRHPTPWAKTTVVTALEGEDLVLTVNCFEPAADKMDFSRRDHDFVWGDDCVTFIFGDEKTTRSATVYLTGEIEKRGDWQTDFTTSLIPHPSSLSYTLRVRIRLSLEEVAAGQILGNVCRWRVGDRRHPKETRVKGSRYEHSRLGTSFTSPNDDPAAFVTFRLSRHFQN